MMTDSPRARRCWVEYRPFDLCGGCWVLQRVDRWVGCTVGHLEELEWELRDVV